MIRLIMIVGISVLLLSCSTGGTSMLSFAQGDTTTDKGMRYLLGRGVPRDDKQAFYYLSRAANDGDPFAENELAYIFSFCKAYRQK